MDKKIIIGAVLGFFVGVGGYFLFMPQSSQERMTKPFNVESSSSTVTTSSSSTVTNALQVTFEKKSTFTVDVKDSEITLYENSQKKKIFYATHPDVFVSAFPIEKTGERFLVVVKHQDELFDFGILTSKTQNFEMITKGSGIKNIGSGMVFSPGKVYAAFQFVRNQGECKKDLMIAILRLRDGTILYPDVERSYEIGTGKWQAEMGAYRFVGDHTLQFMDMPRACDNSGDYTAQKYYSWNIETGTYELMKF